jgi:hypothetical protein
MFLYRCFGIPKRGTTAFYVTISSRNYIITPDLGQKSQILFDSLPNAKNTLYFIYELATVNMQKVLKFIMFIEIFSAD